MNCQPTHASVKGCPSLVIQVHTIPPLGDSFTLLVAAIVYETTLPPRSKCP